MRKNWTSGNKSICLTRAQIEELLEPILHGETVAHCTPATGGLANTSVRVALTGREDHVLLRLFTRDASQATKEFNLLKLLAQRVPAPLPLHFAESNSITGHPYLVLQWVEGERLDLVAERTGLDEIVSLGEAVGEALGAVHSIKFPQSGLFDQDLEISVPMEMGSRGLIGFIEQCLKQKTAQARLGAGLGNSLLAFLENEANLLDTWTDAPCLTHADFGGTNIIVSLQPAQSPEAQPLTVELPNRKWQVAAILDWEFACSGSPFMDFGNLLRKPLGTLPGFENAVYTGYLRSGCALPENWRDMSLLVDLTAWVEFLTRPDICPELIEDAKSVIGATIQGWGKSKICSPQ